MPHRASRADIKALCMSRIQNIQSGVWKRGTERIMENEEGKREWRMANQESRFKNREWKMEDGA